MTDETKKEETKVEIYRGKEGLKAVLKDIIREKKDYIAFGEEGRFQKVLPIDITATLRTIWVILSPAHFQW